MQHIDGKLSGCLANSQPTFTNGIKDTECSVTEEEARDPNLNFVKR